MTSLIVALTPRVQPSTAEETVQPAACDDSNVPAMLAGAIFTIPHHQTPTHRLAPMAGRGGGLPISWTRRRLAGDGVSFAYVEGLLRWLVPRSCI